MCTATGKIRTQSEGACCSTYSLWGRATCMQQFATWCSTPLCPRDLLKNTIMLDSRLLAAVTWMHLHSSTTFQRTQHSLEWSYWAQSKGASSVQLMLHFPFQWSWVLSIQDWVIQELTPGTSKTCLPFIPKPYASFMSRSHAVPPDKRAHNKLHLTFKLQIIQELHLHSNFIACCSTKHPLHTWFSASPQQH
jgi:hypothetical protein